MDTDKILAMDNKQANSGELAHSVRAAQHLIHKLCDVVDKIQITGRLRHLDYNGHSRVELLAIPKTMTNLIGEPSQGTQLHERLYELISNWECAIPPNYKWTGAFYHYSLTTVSTASQLTIAQVIHSGPQEFVDWITKTKSHFNGALPWGFSVQDYMLRDNNKNYIDVLDEEHFFDAIGYQFIALDDRNDGNPEYWSQYKIPNKE